MTFYLFITTLHPSTSLNLNLFYSRRGQSCLMDRVGLVTQRSQVRVSGRNCRWGEWMSSALSTLNTTTEVPLSKVPNTQLLPGCHSLNDYPLLCVCVHGVCTLDGLNAEHDFQVWVTILGHTSLHFYSILSTLYMVHICIFSRLSFIICMLFLLSTRNVWH